MSTEHIQALMQAKGVDWKTAASAFADARKQLTPKKKKGFGGLGSNAAPTDEQIRERALVLLEEPARQPAAVEGLKRIKKETKLPIAVCRLAMEQANHHPDKALEILRTNPPTVVKKRRRSAVKLNRLVNGAYWCGDDLVLEVVRRTPLDKEQKRISREMARNGEHPGLVQDVCLVRRRDGQWQRITPFYRELTDCAVAVDGSLHHAVAYNARAGERGSQSLSRVLSRASVDAEDVAHDLPVRITGIAAGDGLLATPWPIHPQPDQLWARPTGQAWTKLPLPPQHHQLTALAMRGDRAWVSAIRYLGYYADGTWTEVPCEPAQVVAGALPFSHIAFGPDGQIAALTARLHRGGDLWLGDECGLTRELAGVESTQLAFVGDRLFYDRTGFGIFVRDGDGDRCVLEPTTGKFGKKETPMLASDGKRLVAVTAKRVMTLADDDTWQDESLDTMWDAVGTDDLWWTTSPPDWFPDQPRREIADTEVHVFLASSGQSHVDCHVLARSVDTVSGAGESLIIESRAGRLFNVRSGQFSDLWRAPDGTVYATGPDGVSWCANPMAGGGLWTTDSLPTPVGHIDGVGERVFVFANDPAAPVYYRAGDQWVAQPSPGRIRRIHGANDNEVFACGDDGLIARWTESGWAALATGTTGNFRDIFVASHNEIYAAHETGLWRGSGDEWSVVVEHPGKVLAVCMWNDVLWVSTKDRGLCHLEGIALNSVKDNQSPIRIDARSALLMVQREKVACTLDGGAYKAWKEKVLRDLWQQRPALPPRVVAHRS